MSRIPLLNDNYEITFKTTDRVEAARWFHSSDMSLALWNIRMLLHEDADNEEPKIPEEMVKKIYEYIDDLDEFCE